MTDITYNNFPSAAYAIHTGFAHDPRGGREERGRLVIVSTIGHSPDRDGQDFDVLAVDFDFDRERAAHGHVESLGPAVHGRIGDAGVGEGADVDDEGGTVRSHELGQQGPRQLRGEPGVDVDGEVGLLGCALLQRLDFDAAADVVDQDDEIEAVEAGREAGREVVDLPARERGSVEDGGSESDVSVLGLELGFRSLELFGVSAVQDDVETFGGELVGDAETDAITGPCHQGPGTVGVEVALYGRGSRVEVDETEEFESCEGGCRDAQCGE